MWCSSLFQASSANNLIIDEYMKDAKTPEEIRDAFTEIIGDLLMTLPVVKVAGYHSGQKASWQLCRYMATNVTRLCHTEKTNWLQCWCRLWIIWCSFNLISTWHKESSCITFALDVWPLVFDLPGVFRCGCSSLHVWVCTPSWDTQTYQAQLCEGRSCRWCRLHVWWMFLGWTYKNHR